MSTSFMDLKSFSTSGIKLFYEIWEVVLLLFYTIQMSWCHFKSHLIKLNKLKNLKKIKLGKIVNEAGLAQFYKYMQKDKTP